MKNKRPKKGYSLLEIICQGSHLTWFYYTVADSVYAPNLQGQLIFATLSGAYAKSISENDLFNDKEFRLLHEVITSCENFHQATRASDWIEAGIKATIGDIITTALYAVLESKERKKITPSSYIIHELENFVSKNPLVRSRVELYCRRILSESITLGQNIFALYADSIEKDNRIKDIIEKVSAEKNSEEIALEEIVAISQDDDKKIADSKKAVVLEPILNTIVNLTSHITKLYEIRMALLGLHETIST